MLELIRELLIVSLGVNFHLGVFPVAAVAFSFCFFCLMMGLILFRLEFPNLFRFFLRPSTRFCFFEFR